MICGTRALVVVTTAAALAAAVSACSESVVSLQGVADTDDGSGADLFDAGVDAADAGDADAAPAELDARADDVLLHDASAATDVPADADLRDAFDAASDAGADVFDVADVSDAGTPDVPDVEPVDECPRVRVEGTGGIGLNVRPDPSTAGAPLGNLPDGSIVTRVASVEGQSIDGNTLWYEIDRPGLHGFVSSAWAVCVGPATPGDTDDVFLLPFGCGEARAVTQGNNSAFSHNGRAAWSFDFSMGVGTPMLAMKPGTVTFAYAGTTPGHPCYNGGGSDCINAANYVVVLHPDGTQTLYAHLSAVHVGVGAEVAQGTAVGASGSTGWSTGPHAHIERSNPCGRAFCDTIGISFADVPGDGVPVSGQTVTSGNGCD